MRAKKTRNKNTKARSALNKALKTELDERNGVPSAANHKASEEDLDSGGSDGHASGGSRCEELDEAINGNGNHKADKGERDALLALANIGRPEEEEEEEDEMDGTNLAMIQNAMAKLIQTKKDTAKQKENELLQEVADKVQDNYKKLDQHVKRERMAVAKTWKQVSDSLKEKLEETDNRAEHLKARAEAEISQVLEELNEIQQQAVELNESLQMTIQDKCRNLKRKISQAREEASVTIAEAESKLKKSKHQAKKLPGLKRVLQDLC